MPDQRPESLDPSDDDLVNREADPAAAKARAKAQRPWYKKKRWLLAIAFALLVATAPLVPDAEVKPSRSTVAAQAFDPQSDADERHVDRFFKALGPLSAAQASARLKQDLQGYLAPLDAYADVQDRFVQLADEERRRARRPTTPRWTASPWTSARDPLRSSATSDSSRIGC